MRRQIFAFWCMLALAGGASGQKSGSNLGPTEEQSLERPIVVRKLAGGYKVAPGGTAGAFRTNQAADLALNSFGLNAAGGGLAFDHPSQMATDGTRLFLADTRNNRVMVWNTLPTANVEPDLVLGQTSMNTGAPGQGLNQMNWPTGVSAGGGKLVVADQQNNRILIWNQVPTRSGQSADLALTNIFTASQTRPSYQWIVRPTQLWTDGKKLVAGCGDATIKIWNTFPTQAVQFADVVIGTDRTNSVLPGSVMKLSSDGTRLIAGVLTADNDIQSTHFWNTLPTRNDQPPDFNLEASPGEGDTQIESISATFLPDGKVAAFGAPRLYLWNQFPKDGRTRADLTVGYRPGVEFVFHPFRSSGILWAGGRLYLSPENDNRILVYNGLPTRQSQQPDFAIGGTGTTNLFVNDLDANSIYNNPRMVSDGQHLFGTANPASDFTRSVLMVYKKLPDQDHAIPDLLYEVPSSAGQVAVRGNTLALATTRSLYLWNTLPLNGELPDSVVHYGIGEVQFLDLFGVAMDAQYTYLTDRGKGKLYVYEGLPKGDSQPKFTLDVRTPHGVNSDGTWLVISAGSNGIYVMKTSDLGKAQPAQLRVFRTLTIAGLGVYVADVRAGSLYLADAASGRIMIWRRIEDALAGNDGEVSIGDPGVVPSQSGIGQEMGSNVFMFPNAVSFDGSYLWMSEFKLSSRVLRFSPGK